MHTDRSINQKCDDLTQLLGAVCLPFCQDLPDSQVIIKSVFENQISTVQSLINRTLDSGSFTVEAQGSDSLFAIPLEPKVNPAWIAVGKLGQMSSQFAVRLVSVAYEAMLRNAQTQLQSKALEQAELELEDSFRERSWLRHLNAMHSRRPGTSRSNSRQVFEAARRFLNADAIGVYFYPDRDQKSKGLSSHVSSINNLSISDLRFLLHSLPKPELGGQMRFEDLELHVNKTVAFCVEIVPVGDVEVLGYVIAINAKSCKESKQTRMDILLDIADFLIADSYTNSLLSDSERLVLGTLHSMSTAIEARDPYTHGHSERVAHVAFKIGERLSLSESSCQEIYLSGILHDIGKIGIPDSVLLKPGKLTKEEFAIIQQHPEIGYKIIDELGKLRFALPGILYHHERFDGMGYPHRLKGQEIPLKARILAVADAFDAMTSSRVYRNALDRAKAGEILKEGRGLQWDADAVDACLDWLEKSSDDRQEVIGMENLSSTNKRGLLSRALRAVQL